MSVGGFVLPLVQHAGTSCIVLGFESYNGGYDLLGGGIDSSDKSLYEGIMREAMEESIGLFYYKENKNYNLLKGSVTFLNELTIKILKSSKQYKINNSVVCILPILPLNLQIIQKNKYYIETLVDDDKYHEMSKLNIFKVSDIKKFISTGILLDSNGIEMQPSYRLYEMLQGCINLL